jgi:hypothetical protein
MSLCFDDFGICCADVTVLSSAALTCWKAVNILWPYMLKWVVKIEK